MSTFPGFTTAAPLFTDVSKKISVANQLTKGRGVITVDGQDVKISCRYGTVYIFSDKELKVVVVRPSVLDKLLSIPNSKKVDDTTGIFLLGDYKEIKKVLRPKRNISPETRQKRRERMLAYWAARKAAKSALENSSSSEETQK